MWNLIRKDLIRRWRSPVSTLVMLAFPVMMSLLIGSVSGGGSGEDMPRIRVLVVNQDEDGWLPGFVLGALGDGEQAASLDLVSVELDEGRAAMDAGKASAMVVFPPDFTSDVINRRGTTLQVVRNPREGILPEIVELGAGFFATVLDAGTEVLGPQLAQLSTMLEDDDWPEASEVSLLAVSIFGQIQGLEKYLFPPVVKLESTKEVEEGNGGGFDIFGYIMVMVMVMALLFIASNAMNDLWEELESGMLRRQMATTLGLSEIVAAKLVFGLVLGLVALVILLILGAALRWFEPPVDLAGLAVMSISYCFAAAGVMTVVIGASRTPKQAAFLSWLVIMGMSALGGSMVPIQMFPEGMQQVARLTINFWAIDGLSEVLISGKGLSDVTRHVLILVGAGVVTGVVGHRIMMARFAKVAP